MTRILIVGASTIGREYGKILTAMHVPFRATCRSDQSAEQFNSFFPDACQSGGIQPEHLEGVSHAIVAVGVEELASVCQLIASCGIKNILVEKPAGLTPQQILDLSTYCQTVNCTVAVAYNRRCYASVRKAIELINQDGGAISGTFEFTEWSHKIAPLIKAPGVKENWFLANSTHIVDTAFFLLGKPQELTSFTANQLSWHDPAIFSGAGRTENGALFSYCSNWLSAGRWGIEIHTRIRKLILCPLELLSQQKIGEISTTPVSLDNSDENGFKPGFYLQTKHFLDSNFTQLKLLDEQVRDLDFYQQISGISPPCLHSNGGT